MVWVIVFSVSFVNQVITLRHGLVIWFFRCFDLLENQVLMGGEGAKQDERPRIIFLT